MKYIRTKDELGIESEDGTCCFRTWAANSNSPLKEDWLYADTIEELSDCCVCFIKDEYQPYICPVKDIEHLRKLEQFGGKIKTNRVYKKVYLAIWTDKGLIYVAYMNEKGVLELL